MLNRATSPIGPHVHQVSVVETALELLKQQPNRPALDILDEAMRCLQGQELDYAFDDEELRPPHAFAELLRRAFAPNVRLSALSAQRRWRQVVLPFAQRYHIWEPDDSLH